MSYAYKPECDVTIVPSFKGVVCLECKVSPEVDKYGNYLAPNTRTMIAHIQAHRAFGDVLPDEIELQLVNDDWQNYPKFKKTDESK